jgi:hypothetical protein
MKKALLIAALSATIFGCNDTTADTSTPSLIKAISQGPIQTNVDKYKIENKFADVTVKADYKLTARVYSQRYYLNDRQAQLIPFDIAYSWGDLAEDPNFKKLKVKQRNRWAYWRYDKGFMSGKDIIKSISNTHVIPASEAVSDTLRKLDKGDVIQLEGHLVDAIIDKKYIFRSSMSRTDTGDGACEVFYVTSAKVYRGIETVKYTPG